ncbi:MAG: hypothetical protein IJJ04_02455 [Clostridia bacterium]|nr:hypothetical protein [Clostridia bacterium]
MEIKTTTIYSKKLLKSIYRFNLLCKLKFLIIVEVLLLIMLLMEGSILFFILIYTLFHFIIFFVFPNIYVKLNKKLIGGKINFVFKENSVNFVSTTQYFSGNNEVMYQQFDGVYETKDCLYIYERRGAIYTLIKNNVEENKCVELIELLKSKFPGKKYKKVRFNI